MNDDVERQPSVQEGRRSSKTSKVLAAILFKTAVLTGCAPQIIDHQPTPIVVDISPSEGTPPPSIATEDTKPSFEINGVNISEFPYYPSADQLIVEPPVLGEVSEEDLKKIKDATCVVMFIPDFDGSTLNGFPIAGVLTNNSYVLSSRHLVEDENGNSQIGPNSAIVVVHPSGVIARVGGQPIYDPTGQDIMALKVDGFADLPSVPIDVQMPSSGSTIVESTWHRFRTDALAGADVFRGIFVGNDQNDPNSVLIRGGLDTTPVNKSEPGASGGPLFNPETGAVFAINVGQVGYLGPDGKPTPGYMTKRVTIGANNQPTTEDLGPYDVSTAAIPSAEFLELLR